jgi:hypothetical protein
MDTLMTAADRNKKTATKKTENLNTCVTGHYKTEEDCSSSSYRVETYSVKQNCTHEDNQLGRTYAYTGTEMKQWTSTKVSRRRKI